jgi:hypothetical protein
MGQAIVLQGNATSSASCCAATASATSARSRLGGQRDDRRREGGRHRAMGSGYPAVLALSGTVHATMTPGNIADYATSSRRWPERRHLRDARRQRLADGQRRHLRRRRARRLRRRERRLQPRRVQPDGSSRLDLNNVQLNVESSGIFLYGDATQVNLTGSVVHAAANTAGLRHPRGEGTPQVTLVNSAISGFDHAYSHASAGISVGTFAQPGVAADADDDEQRHHVEQPRRLRHRHGSSPSSLTWTGTNTSVAINTHGGIVCRDACNVDLSGGEISENATNDPGPATRSTAASGWAWRRRPTSSSCATC